jgi:hypothetical protein
MPFTGYGAFTAPINPPDATPVITRDQAWRALMLKAGKPQAFVLVIDKCEVVSRHESGLTRRTLFKEGQGPAKGWVTEEIQFLGNTKVRSCNLCLLGVSSKTNIFLVHRSTSSWSRPATRSRTS